MDSTNSIVAPTYINVYHVPKQSRNHLHVTDGFASKLIALGGFQLAIGLIMFMMTHAVMSSALCLGEAILSGALFVVAGVLGVVAGKRRTRCTVVTFNILSILSACYGGNVFFDRMMSAKYGQNHEQPAGSGLNEEFVIAFLGFAEAIVAIVSSAVCCMIGACCCDCNSCCCCPPSTDSDQDEDVDFTKGDYDLVVRNPGQGFYQMQNMTFSKQHPMFHHFAPLLHGESNVQAHNSQPPPEYDNPNFNYTKLKPDDP